MILMIDNYDSFTYNLVQYLGEMGQTLEVHRHDEIDLPGIRRLKPARIVISPGPGAPKDAGISNATIREFAGKIPMFGVCLGHQCIGEVFGGQIVLAGKVMHGKTSEIFHNGSGLFKGLENPFTATRYHSLLVERASLPDCLEVTAWTEQNEIMGIAHKKYPIVGVQFHPESILTKAGKAIIKNFLESYG